MCGITGVYDARNFASVDRELLVAMANEMSHRGPDELSCFMNANVGFGFRRLSIVDVKNGHQPFFSDDESIVVICNGEIYNHKEFRVELERKGYSFNTDCDIEVIVNLYLEYGKDFISRLNGQFALAILDKRDNSLLLARDHFGICPLFYTQLDGLFIFGSEIKAIIKHPDVKRQVNLEGLDQVFTFPGLVSPVTMFKGINSVPPGHYVLVKDKKLIIKEYWDLDYAKQSEPVAEQSESYYADKLEELLLQSVKYRLNAEVPVGFYLSGGLDSSLIGALMKSVGAPAVFPSFSIGFPSDNEFNEQVHQQQMAKHLGGSNTCITFDSSEVEKRLKQAVWTAESALKETYNTCSLALSETVQNQGIKVILSGEGADELFGGYIGYRFDKQRQKREDVRDLEEQLEDEYRNKLWGDKDFFYEKDYYEFSALKRSLYTNKVQEQFNDFDAVKHLCFNKERVKNIDLLHKRSYIDLKLRLSDHLIADHCDRVTYANSIEGRFPFLDINLIEFVKTIPPELKLNGLIEKYILKKVAAKYIPESIINRQKFGFIAPGSPSLMQQNIEWINDLLSYDRIKRQGYFDADMVERLKKQYQKKDFRLNLPYDSDLLIIIITFNIFLELFEMPAIS